MGIKSHIICGPLASHSSQSGSIPELPSLPRVPITNEHGTAGLRASRNNQLLSVMRPRELQVRAGLELFRRVAT